MGIELGIASKAAPLPRFASCIRESDAPKTRAWTASCKGRPTHIVEGGRKVVTEHLIHIDRPPSSCLSGLLT